MASTYALPSRGFRNRTLLKPGCAEIAALNGPAKTPCAVSSRPGFTLMVTCNTNTIFLLARPSADSVFLSQHISLLALEIPGNADNHEFQRRFAGGGESPGFAQRGWHRVAGMNLCCLPADGGGAVAADHI